MGYKDPERARRANAEKQARHRRRQSEKKLAGPAEPAESPPISAAPKSTTITHAEWTERKLQIGQFLCSAAMQVIKKATNSGRYESVGARDATVMLRMGIDLVNSNMDSRPIEPETKDDLTWVLMQDPEYRAIQEKALLLQAEIMAKKGLK